VMALNGCAWCNQLVVFAGLTRSAIGAVVFTCLFITWVSIVQTQWEAWGMQSLMVTYPASESIWWLDNS
jgi:hypothetical protein